MKKFKIPKKKREKWINALNSGRYKQTTRTLTNGKAYCCLGVYSRCNRIYDGGNSISYPPHDQLEKELQSRCIELNDTNGKGFKEIAKYIKSNTVGV